MIRPNQERAKVAMILIWAILTVILLSLWFDFQQYDLLIRIRDRSNFNIDEAESNDLRQKMLAITHVILYIISAVTFIRWFRRAYYNLHQRVTDYLQYAESDAASCWFIPIINLARPYKIMSELFERTGDFTIKDNNIPRLSQTLIGFWWGFWIAGNIFGNISARYSVGAKSIDDLLTGTVLSLINSVIGITLSVLTLKLIHDYSVVENHLERNDSKQKITNFDETQSGEVVQLES